MARMMGILGTAAAALSLAVTPAVAAERSASMLSLNRASTEGENASQVIGPALYAVVGVGIVVGVILLVDDDDDDAESP